MNEYKYKIEPFGCTFNLIICNDFSKVEKKYNLENTDLHTSFFFENDKGFHIVVRDKNISAGILAHECLHAVNAVCDYVHIRLDQRNDELQCYLLTWFMDKCYESFEHE